MRQGKGLIWKVATSAEKDEAPAVAEAQLLPRMVDELIIVNHKVMTESTKKSSQMWLIKFAPFRTSWTDIVRRGNGMTRTITTHGQKEEEEDEMPEMRRECGSP